MFHRLLLVPALLALTTVPGAAQSSVPVCVSYANWSTAVAATEIVLGIANQESVPDCYGDNWAMCNSAAVHFNTAYNNLAQIFNGAAAGPNCLRCIISVLQTQADSLDEQEKILYAKGFRSDIGAISRTLKTWAGTPYCAPAAAAPALVPLGPGSAATAGPGTASTAGIAGSYICVVKCQPGGRPARIDQSGSSLTFTNEGGGMSAGSLAGPGIVVAHQWGNLRGEIANNGSEIRWANGTVWRRH